MIFIAKLLFKIILGLCIFILSFVAGVYLFMWLAPVFGGKPDANSEKKIHDSANFKKDKFVNLIPLNQATNLKIDNKWITKANEINSSGWSFLKDFIFPPATKLPQKPLPSQKLDASQLKNNSFTWLGHSTILIKTHNQIILTDPVFYRASPINMVGKPFAYKNPTSIADLPKIDLVLISHDHYDHLDYKAIRAINSKVQTFLVPLGIKAHLQKWGVNSAKIHEFDWYETKEIAGINYTFTPARHFSGRSLLDRFATLWGSWVVQSPNLQAFFSGDGGYSPEFKKIGQKFHGFDIAFMENGAYNTKWSQVHMQPEESLQAALDLNAKIFVPIHWAKFDLSIHNWCEPAQRITQAIKLQNNSSKIQLATPLIGQTFTLDALPNNHWWQDAQ